MASQLAIHFSSETVEWYTPPRIIQRVLAVMGGIDLDPCAEPGRAIPAVTHYTQEQNALQYGWHGRVYMNPPYGDVIGEWVNKLRTEYSAGRVTEAVALLPARTDTAWMLPLLRECPVCFVQARLRFSGHKSGAPFPSAVVYLGSRPDKFALAFGDIGVVMQRQEPTP